MDRSFHLIASSTVQCEILWGVGGTVASESASEDLQGPFCRGFEPRHRRPGLAWPDGGPESLRSPCCGLAIYKNQAVSFVWFLSGCPIATSYELIQPEKPFTLR
ncbi:hypothetical protein PoB_005895800 [Plakobranchus ocellatus]|uniref:Uncharacterized protein n=1 Tax=Plakobranchus ocellatus TaxID=259542 RepID=A0AAV4CKD3_9GAST|nr:hypothetical protein PoB_005895800 [Plakobranchus ocellatus]